MPFDFDRDFVKPTAAVIAKIKGKVAEVVERPTAWERVGEDDFLPDPKRGLFRRDPPLPGIIRIKPEGPLDRLRRWWRNRGRP